MLSAGMKFRSGYLTHVVPVAQKMGNGHITPAFSGVPKQGEEIRT